LPRQVVETHALAVRRCVFQIGGLGLGIVGQPRPPLARLKTAFVGGDQLQPVVDFDDPLADVGVKRLPHVAVGYRIVAFIEAHVAVGMHQDRLDFTQGERRFGQGQ